MRDKAKPFLSENNPLNMETYKGEGFSYKYFFPQYWLGWIIILLSFILTYLPKIFRDSIGTFLGFFIYKQTIKERKLFKRILLCVLKKKVRLRLIR